VDCARACHRAAPNADPLGQSTLRTDLIVKQREGTGPHSHGMRCPRFASVFTLNKQRAQGKPGARCTRGLACKWKQENAHEHTGSAEAIRPSLRNGFTAYNALSLVTGLSCHHHRRDTSRQLDASVGASGPHDFAVRLSHVRLRDLSVHRISPQRS
jgi:hypothetical protein